MNVPREESAAGDDASPESPLNEWVDEYRDRLRNLINREMDQRLRGRVDPSDIVQDTFATANRILPDYLRDRPVPVYQWLKQIAINCLKDTHRRHILAAKQAVDAEQHPDDLGNSSFDALNAFLADTDIGPGRQTVKNERGELLQRGLEQLRPDDQRILSLRYTSGLRVKEIAVQLNVSESAVKVRHFRALQRLRVILRDLHFDET